MARKPAVIFLKNKAYRVRIPTGHISQPEGKCEWDAILDALGEENSLLHWSGIWTWCQEPVRSVAAEENPIGRFLPVDHSALRGCTAPRGWNVASQDIRANYMGFRPILEPVDPETMTLDRARWADVPTGTGMPLGTLYMDDNPLTIPKNPIDTGDIPDYVPGAQLRIGRTLTDPDKQIRVIKCGDIFIADRVLIKNISWADLDRLGLVYGQKAKPQIRVPKMQKHPKASPSKPTEKKSVFKKR